MNRILRLAVSNAARQTIGQTMTSEDVEAALLERVEDSGTVEGEYEHGDNALAPHCGWMRWFTLRLSQDLSIRVTMHVDISGVYDDENGERREVTHSEHDDFRALKAARIAKAEQCTHEPERFSDWCATCGEARTAAAHSLWYRGMCVTQYDLISETEAAESPLEIKDTEYENDVWEHCMTSPEDYDDALKRIKSECDGAQAEWFNWGGLIELANQHIPREGV